MVISNKLARVLSEGDLVLLESYAMTCRVYQRMGKHKAQLGAAKRTYRAKRTEILKRLIQSYLQEGK